ncbi:hypothetical protein BC835DRAFT_817218 [Cytidiella melzeri]|nr:hypothetical protein BC835DRAFT_817218 [Cytidiella melzeri]
MPEEGPSAKKSKPNGSSSSLQPAAKITERPSPRIEELQDQVMFSPVTQSEPDSNVVLPAQTIEPEEKSERSPSSTPATLSYNNNPFSAAALGSKSGLGVKSSAPKAPSKLRYSIQVEKEDSPKEAGKSLPSLGLGLPSSRPGPSVATLSPVAAPSLSASSPSNTAASTISTSITSISTVKGSAPKTPEEIKAFVAAVPVADLPQYTFDFPLFSPGAGPSVEKAKAAAKDVPVTSLPAYDFDSPPRSTASAGKTSVSSDTSAVKEVFDWAAAGLKMPSKPADNWDCSVCGLSNPPTAVSKCQVCEEPKPGASKAPAAPAFDWAAAGMKQPVATAGWKCSTCMLDNADSLTKCSVCESPR